MIKNCMKKGIYNTFQNLCVVVAVNVHQTVHVDSELEIKAFYAGHVSMHRYTV